MGTFSGGCYGLCLHQANTKGQDLGGWILQIIAFFKSFFRQSSKIKVTHRSKPRKKAKAATEASHATSPLSTHTSEQDEIDAILDKISQKGYESLTKEEKQKLFNASKR